MPDNNDRPQNPARWLNAGLAQPNPDWLNWQQQAMEALRRGAQVQVNPAQLPIQAVEAFDWLDDPVVIQKQENVEIKMDTRLSSPERTTKFPRFRMPYDGREEWRLRIAGTVIYLFDEPYYINEVTTVRDEVTGEVGLGVEAVCKDGLSHRYILKDHGLNLRTPDPGYINFGASVVYLYREPARIYKQGINRENAKLKKVGSLRTDVLTNGQMTVFLKGLHDRPIVEYNQNMRNQILNGERAAIRLCDRLALYYRKSQNPVGVEYKGRFLGYVTEDHVVVTGPKDGNFPAIREALSSVGLPIEVK